MQKGGSIWASHSLQKTFVANEKIHNAFWRRERIHIGSLVKLRNRKKYMIVSAILHSPAPLQRQMRRKKRHKKRAPFFPSLALHPCLGIFTAIFVVVLWDFFFCQVLVLFLHGPLLRELLLPGLWDPLHHARLHQEEDPVNNLQTNVKGRWKFRYIMEVLRPIETREGGRWFF